VRFHIPIFIAAALLVLPACESEHTAKPHPVEYMLHSPYAGVRTVAVAPSFNLSPSHDFDPLVVSDLLFAELQSVQSIHALPVNKTLAAMATLKMRGVRTAQDAQALAAALGADAIIVPAVTAYDPYRPPVVGMTLQLYTVNEMAAPAEPVARQITGQPLAQAAAEPSTGSQPVSQVSAMFNANNQTVLLELQDFAKGRTDYGSALQEDRYLADSEAYMRFVCHAMIRRMLDVESTRVNGR